MLLVITIKFWMMKTLLYCCGLLSLFTLPQCTRTNNISPVIPNQKASEYFPNKIGDYWEYEVYDSSHVRDHPDLPRRYTVKVTITGIKKLIDNKDAYVWEYEYPYGKGIKYIRLEKDTVKVFDTTYSKTTRDLEFPREIYLLPFQNNKNWRGKLLDIDSFYINKVNNLMTSYGAYNNCFNIYRHYLGPEIVYNDHYWFVPDVGFVKIYYHEYNMGPTLIQVWQLKQYLLK